jgi:predicted nucleic acid-binding protein
MIVVDASVLAVAIGDDGESGFLARSAIAGHQISAPDLVDVETVSVLRARWRAGALSAERFAAAVDDLSDFPADRYPTLPFMRRAYQLRSNVTAYDATYVALAEQLGCPLVTADVRLTNAPGVHCRTTLLAVAMKR